MPLQLLLMIGLLVNRVTDAGVDAGKQELRQNVVPFDENEGL